MSDTPVAAMYPDDQYQIDLAHNPDYRDVTSTARLFNFKRPVYMSARAWEDCVNQLPGKDRQVDELAVLQRLRHVLFMAASALHGRTEDLEYDFRVYRVPSTEGKSGQPEPVTLHLVAHRDEHNRPIITIRFPEED